MDSRQINGKTWMSKLDPDAYLAMIHLPGTHNSAASGDIHISKTPDAEKTDSINKLKTFSWVPGVKFFAKKFTLTQDLSIEEQLNQGIRAFDFRLLYNNGTIYLSHSFALCKFEKAIQDIKDFMDKNKSEILVIQIKADYEHENGMYSYHKDAYNLINAKLGNLLIKKVGTTETLFDEKFTIGNLRYLDERILVVYEPQSCLKDIWSDTIIRNHWANKPTANEVLDNFKNAPKADQATYHQIAEASAVATPNSSSIQSEVCRFFTTVGTDTPYGVKKEAKQTNHQMLNFLEDAKNSNFADATNIVNMDFPSPDSIHRVIKMNK